MSQRLYKWQWTTAEGSERKIEINTMMGEDVARERALSFFLNDPVAQEYIQTNPPEIHTTD